MSGVSVQCPHCEKSFRIADRGLLGRTGKCSACGRKFTLKEAVVPATTASDRGKPKPVKEAKETARSLRPPDAPRTKAAEPVFTAADEEPRIGVNARWVPDDSPFQAGNSAVTAIGTSTPTVVAGDNPFGESVPSSPEIAAEDPTSAAAMRKRRQQRQKAVVIGVVGVAILIGGLAAILLPMMNSKDSRSKTSTASGAVPETVETLQLYTREMLESNLALLDEFRPTKGQPIDMRYVPNGVNVVVQLRPAELWGTDRTAAELRASLTEGVVSWLESQIKTVCRREPSQITEATMVFVLGAFGTEPRTAAVVHLKEPGRQADLVKEFGGKLLDENLQPPITVTEKYAYVLVDTKTFAVAPADTALELQDALKTPNGYVSVNVAELLKKTDRDRLLTIAAEVPDVRRHLETLFPESVRPLAAAVLDWLGEDVDAIAWSLHARPTLHSELILRPRAGVAPTALKSSIQSQLDVFPGRLVDLAKTLNPRQEGFRDMIGRFPAMMEAVRQSTVLHVGPQQVTATTVLPAKAAPNLALGALLTWDESRRTTSSSSSGAPTVASTSSSSQTIAEKLKTPILAEFNRTPLEQAIQYIGDQTGVDFSVDGDALRMTGYTRNMPQTMSLGKVPATEALKQILGLPNQKDLAVFVDEGEKKAVLSTKPYLKQKGKAEYAIP